MVARFAFVLLCALLCACASNAPVAERQARPWLSLTPASLGRELSLQQQLTVIRDGQRRRASALLEINGTQLRLALIVAQRRMLSVSWDGRELDEERDPELPAGLQGARFVDDIVLAYWPLEVLRAALPPGHRLIEHEGKRILTDASKELARIEYLDGENSIVIERRGYRLEIQSSPP